MASPAPEATLIGLCDGKLDDSKYRPTFLTNKVGGRPDWMPVISPQSPRCRRCEAPLLHVVQVYCPLDASPYHRNLHLFACPGPGCSSGPEGWTVLRSQCLEAEARSVSRPEPPQEAPGSASDWCDGADDWGVEEEDGWGGEEEEEDGWGGEEEEGPEEAAGGGGGGSGGGDAEVDVSLQLQQLRVGGATDGTPVLRSLFISVVDESDLGGDEEELRHARRLLREYESREGAAVGALEGDGGGGGGEEKYEKMKARHGDAVFSRFMKQIWLCPQQILRYRRGGRPLFISEPPRWAVPPCGACGGSRTFELQLMPALVSLLQTGGGGGGGGDHLVEFGTVLVYTCTNSCWGAGSTSALEEACLVQGDPDHDLFR